MTAIVTRLPGGISQVFNPETGKITYKCKAESGYLKLDSFGGIIKFKKNGSKAIVQGPIAHHLRIVKFSKKEILDTLMP